MTEQLDNLQLADCKKKKEKNVLPSLEWCRGSQEIAERAISMGQSWGRGKSPISASLGDGYQTAFPWVAPLKMDKPVLLACLLALQIPAVPIFHTNPASQVIVSCRRLSGWHASVNYF